jgi:hypothetical protein
MSIHVINWVLRHSEATLGCRLVLIAMADTAHDDGSKTFQSVETIAEKARMSRRAVQAALRKLEEEGHIEVTGRTRSGTIVYTIRGVVTSPDEGGEADDGGGEARAGRGEVDDRASGEAASPEPLTIRNRQGTKGALPEPMGFEEWMAAHCELTGQTPPGAATKARADLARKYGALTGEGRSLDDMKLASLGAHSDVWRREHGKDFPRNVLVSEQVDELIEKGRRAAKKTTKAPAGKMVRTKTTDPWDEEL